MGLLDVKLLEVEDAEKKNTSVPNPAYATWVDRDQAFLRYLLKSLSPDILAHGVGLETIKVVWSDITSMIST
jgi:hypothetical protein